MMLTTVIVAVLLAVILAVVAALVLRHKLRHIWRRIWELEKTTKLLEQDNVNLRKNAFLAGAPELRLPPRLPSQHGEDLILWSFFGGRRQGFFVEVGAYDGVVFSNTYFLEALGWRGILVEPNSTVVDCCARARPFSRTVHAALSDTPGGAMELFVVEGERGLDALSYVGNPQAQLDRVKRSGARVRTTTVPRMTLDEVLGEEVTHLDVVSIDVEGHELSVLAGFDIDRFRPDVMVIEDNTHGRDRGVPQLLASHGYVERFRTDCNVFYCRPEEQRRFAFPDPEVRIS